MAEYWDILNVPGRLNCHRSAAKIAQRIAKDRNVAIMVRHHGPRPAVNKDPTRVNYYVWPNGKADRLKGPNGGFVDVS